MVNIDHVLMGSAEVEFQRFFVGMIAPVLFIKCEMYDCPGLRLILIDRALEVGPKRTTQLRSSSARLQQVGRKVLYLL